MTVSTQITDTEIFALIVALIILFISRQQKLLTSRLL